MSDDNKNNNSGTGVAFVFLILYAIVLSNYSYDNAVNDELKHYWIYAFMSLIFNGVIVGVSLLACCGIICAAMKENETCVRIIVGATTTIICLCAVANVVFMYILIHNNPEVAKFKLVDTTGTYPVMLQVVCIIQCFCILVMTAVTVLSGCGALCCFVTDKCSSSLNTPLTPAVQSAENNV